MCDLELRIDLNTGFMYTMQIDDVFGGLTAASFQVGKTGFI